MQKSGQTFTRQVDKLPPQEVLDEIDRKVNMEHLEADADGGGRQEVRRPAKGAAEAGRREAKGRRLRLPLENHVKSC